MDMYRAFLAILISFVILLGYQYFFIGPTQQQVEPDQVTIDAAATGDGASAEKELRRALELGASELDVQPWLARALLLQGDLEPLYELEIPAAASGGEI